MILALLGLSCLGVLCILRIHKLVEIKGNYSEHKWSIIEHVVIISLSASVFIHLFKYLIKLLGG